MDKIVRTYPATRHTAGDLSDHLRSVLGAICNMEVRCEEEGASIVIRGLPKGLGLRAALGLDRYVSVKVAERAGGVAVEVDGTGSLLWCAAFSDIIVDPAPCPPVPGIVLSVVNHARLRRLVRDLASAADAFMLDGNVAGHQEAACDHDVSGCLFA